MAGLRAILPVGPTWHRCLTMVATEGTSVAPILTDQTVIAGRHRVNPRMMVPVSKLSHRELDGDEKAPALPINPRAQGTGRDLPVEAETLCLVRRIDRH